MTEVEAPPREAVIGDNAKSYGEDLEKDPALLFRDPEALPFLLASVEAQIADFKPDLETEKGRKAVASFAYAIAKQKTKFDEAGAALTEEARKQIAAIDAIRRKVRDAFDLLKAKARKPLDDWEKAEEARKQKINGVRELFRQAAIIRAEATVESLKGMRERIAATTIDEAFFGGYARDAIAERQTALEVIDVAIARIEQAEAERAELERLREAERERERQAEAAAKEERRKQREADAEAQRQKDLEAARARAAEEAAEKVRAEERRQQQAEQLRRDNEAAERERQRQAAQAAIDEENARKLREAEAARVKAEAEAATARKTEADRLAAEKREREAEAQRQRDQAHRQSCISAATNAIMRYADIANEEAEKIVLAIVAGEIPHVSLKF